MYAYGMRMVLVLSAFRVNQLGRKMKHSKFDEILNQFEFRNNGYLLFEKYADWFEESIKDGSLKLALDRTLNEANQNNDLRKYDFALLVIQAFDIDFTDEDKHFELLFSMADLITKDFELSENRDKKSWLLHQLTDICIHYDEEIELIVKRNPKLIPSVVRKIGKVKYQLENYGPQMYFAAYKAVGLIWYLPKKEAKDLLEKVYLTHFDERVIDEAEELIEHLKEEGQYD